MVASANIDTKFAGNNYVAILNHHCVYNSKDNRNGTILYSKCLAHTAFVVLFN